MAPGRCTPCDPFRSWGSSWGGQEPLLLRTPSISVGRESRVRTLIASANETSVLNRGLGAFHFNNPSKRKRYQHELWTPWVLVPLIAGGGLTVISVGAIEFNYLWDLNESIFVEESGNFTYGLTCLASIPLGCAIVNFIIDHIRSTTFFWDKEGWGGARSSSSDRLDKKAPLFQPLATWPMVLTTLVLIRESCLRVLIPSLAARMSSCIEGIIALMLLRMYYLVLDLVNASLLNMGTDQEVLNDMPPVKKMQGIVRNITRTGKREKDMVYAFDETNTVPAHVLSYVWWLYYIFGKVFGAGICTAFFLSVDKQTILHFMFSAIIVTAATAIGFLFELGPNTMSLLRLALNKPFYVGDLLTLNRTGAMDNPTGSIMGFVENITMKYIVMRNFQMKQTWIPHESFSKMIIQNWTRRPSKTVLLNIGISCRCPVKKVVKLKDFGFRWIEASPEIQQKNYRKCHITKIANGYNIEVIFFPEIGVSHRGIRQKFLVAFMAAAERLQIPFVPLQVATGGYCDETTTAPVPPPKDQTYGEEKPDTFDGEAKPETADEELFLDDLLPHPEDLLPKGVGMGFKQFPEGSTPGGHGGIPVDHEGVPIDQAP